MSQKNILVSGGDIQIFAAILNGYVLAYNNRPDVATIGDEELVTMAFDTFDEYKRQHSEREDELKSASRQAFKGHCDKAHGGGACRDPDCWQR